MMQNSRGYLISIFFLGILTVLAVVFRSFLFANFAQPVAVVFWFVLRLLEAVDQKIYWILLVLFAFFLAARLIPKAPDIYAQYPETASQSAVEIVKNWRTIITLTTSSGEIDRHNLLRQDLTDLLIAICAADQEDGASNADIYEALKSRKIPLPDLVYRFLFIEKPVRRKSFYAMLQNAIHAPSRWIRRLRGEDITDYFQSIDAVLSFMETSLEISHDNQRPD